MALKKNVVDVPAADGLSQKTSQYRLPPGKSVIANNLVKNKIGQLDKRLGMATLPNTVVGNFVPNVGVALAENQGNVLSIARGNSSTSNATLLGLSQYSIDANEWTYRGPLPEVNITLDQVVSASSSSIANPTDVIVGDFRVQMWIELNPNSAQGTVYYQVMENSTGNVIVPSQPVDSSHTTIGKVELINIGNYLVAVYGAFGSTNTLYVATCSTSTTVPASSGWTLNTLTTLNVTLNNNFAVFAADGDSTHFNLLFSKNNGGNYDLVMDQFLQAGSSAPLLSATDTYVSASTVQPFAYAARASKTNDYAAIVYGLNNSAYTVNAVYGSYVSYVMSASPTAIYTAGNSGEAAPYFFAFGQSTAKQPAILNTFTAAWSPPGGVFLYRSANGGSSSPPTLNHYNDARIIAAQFYLTSGNIVVGTGTATTPTRLTYGLHLASRFLEVNGILYCLGYIPSSTQGGYLLLAADWAAQPNDTTTSNDYCMPMRAVGQIQTRTCLKNPILASNTAVNVQKAPSNFSLGTDNYATAYISYQSTSQGNRTSLAAGCIQFAGQSGYYPSARWGNCTAFGGPLPMSYDGTVATEQNFLYCPECNDDGGWNGTSRQYLPEGILALPTTAGTGKPFTFNTDISDSWSYIVTYEWFDDQGNFVRSARSVPFTITAADIAGYGFDGTGGTNYNIQLTIPTLGVSYKIPSPGAATLPAAATPDASVTIGIYRTIDNGSTYYRIFDRSFDGQDGGSPPLNGTSVASTAALSTTIGSSGSTFITYTDNLSDAIMESQGYPLLYGDGSNGAPGELDDFCPPATPIMIRHKERLFVSRANQILFTKQYNQGLGPGYNEQVNVLYAGMGDSINGCDSLDDKIAFLKQKQIYYVQGDGPSDDGSGNSFSPPQTIPTDAGCIDARSCKSTPDGIYFMSEAGLRLLTRALNVEYVGGPAEDYFSANPILLSTVLYPTNNKILFMVCDDDSAAAASLTGAWVSRDYVLDAWTTATLPNATGPISGISANAYRALPSGRNVVEPVLYVMTKDARVWQERDPASATPYLDQVNTFVPFTWTIPYQRPAGDIGRYRLWDVITFLANPSADPYGINVVITSNYNSGTVTYTWNAAQTNTAASNLAVTQLRNHYGALGEGFGITITDTAAANTVTGQGPSILGLNLVLGVPGGPFKQAAGQSQ